MGQLPRGEQSPSGRPHPLSNKRTRDGPLGPALWLKPRPDRVRHRRRPWVRSPAREAGAETRVNPRLRPGLVKTKTGDQQWEEGPTTGLRGPSPANLGASALSGTQVSPEKMGWVPTLGRPGHQQGALRPRLQDHADRGLLRVRPWGPHREALSLHKRGRRTAPHGSRHSAPAGRARLRRSPVSCSPVGSKLQCASDFPPPASQPLPTSVTERESPSQREAPQRD